MKSRGLIAALVAASALSALPSFASDTYSLGVSATVLGRCKFTQAAGSTLTITNAVGGIDPSLGTNATGTANITYRCTSGQAPTFSTDTGTHASAGSLRVSDGTNFMIYTLGLTGGGNGAGFGAGTDKTLAVTGTILPADYQGAVASTYTDTVVVSVTP